MHHIAFEVADIYAEMERLKRKGFVLLNEQPKTVPTINWSVSCILKAPMVCWWSCARKEKLSENNTVKIIAVESYNCTGISFLLYVVCFIRKATPHFCIH